MRKKKDFEIRQASVSVLEPILAGNVSSDREKQQAAPVELFVGECLDDRHPSITGRVLIAWEDSQSNVIKKWLPSIQGLSVRKLDRVLLQKPVNWSEPIVFGVVDGCVDRPLAKMKSKQSIELKPDEAVRIDSNNGSPLVEVYQENDQPVVRLLGDDVNLDLNGKLKISALGIDLAAKRGQVSITAEGDVVIKGEVVELN
ncbi:MAG: hypothetical protein WBM36_14480 [Lysobacterales bacterium]